MKKYINQKGQMILEAVLLMTVFIGIVAAVATYFKKNEVFAQIVQGPWKNLNGMFQNGMWRPVGVSDPSHPSMHNRHISVQGEEAR